MKDRSLCQAKKATRYKRRIKPVWEDNGLPDEILYHTQDPSINDYRKKESSIDQSKLRPTLTDRLPDREL